jgi:hypothetical protein
VLELQVEASSGGNDLVMVSVERTVPLPPPTLDHEAMAPAVAETLAPSTAFASEGMMGASTSGALSAINFGIVDLDTTDLQNNNRDIFEAVLERILADPV